MVWIHGGGFVGGEGDEKWYGPDIFAQGRCSRHNQLQTRCAWYVNAYGLKHSSNFEQTHIRE